MYISRNEIIQAEVRLLVKAKVFVIEAVTSDVKQQYGNAYN